MTTKKVKSAIIPGMAPPPLPALPGKVASQPKALPGPPGPTRYKIDGKEYIVKEKIPYRVSNGTLHRLTENEIREIVDKTDDPIPQKITPAKGASTPKKVDTPKKERTDWSVKEKAFMQEWIAKLKRVKKEMKNEHVVAILLATVPKGRHVRRAKLLYELLKEDAAPSPRACGNVIKAADLPDCRIPNLAWPLLSEKDRTKSETKKEPTKWSDLKKKCDQTEILIKGMAKARSDLLSEVEDLREDLRKSYEDILEVFTGQAMVLNFVEGTLTQILNKTGGTKAHEEFFSQFQFLRRTLRNEVERAEEMEVHAQQYLKEYLSKQGPKGK